MNLPEGIQVREGTWDADIFRECYEINSYKLPDTLPNSSIVIDIGAHIGGFTYAALDRGAEEVWAYEANPNTFQLLFHNVHRMMSIWTHRPIRLHEALVWRSDSINTILPFYPSTKAENTGGCGVMSVGEKSSVLADIRTIRFDEEVRRASKFGKRQIHLVKLDCEGSEYPILLTSKQLHLIDNICGEYHPVTNIPDYAKIDGVSEFTPDVLKTHLEKQGFFVIIEPSSEGLGLFWAKRN